MPEQPAIKLLWLSLSSIEGENNLRLFERSELERNRSFFCVEQQYMTYVYYAALQKKAFNLLN